MMRFVKLARSFSYALDGLRYAYTTQLNMRIHMLTAVLVSILTLLLPLPVTHILFVTATVFAVIICELVNTAVEALIDMVSPGFHPLAKISKDIAAAAVLVSAFFAVAVGLLIFLPLILDLFRDGFRQGIAVTLESVIAAAAILSLALSACVRTGMRGYNNHQSDRQELKYMQDQILLSSQLNEEEQALLAQAIHARRHAYVPYSEFAVGSAVMAEDGEVYHGCNVENAAYGSTNCAERSALFHAVSRGAKPQRFRMLAVVGDTEQPITPCGACRQVLAELCASDMPVILGSMNGSAVRTTVARLLPGAFTKQALNE